MLIISTVCTFFWGPNHSTHFRFNIGHVISLDLLALYLRILSLKSPSNIIKQSPFYCSVILYCTGNYLSDRILELALGKEFNNFKVRQMRLKKVTNACWITRPNWSLKNYGGLTVMSRMEVWEYVKEIFRAAILGSLKVFPGSEVIHKSLTLGLDILL